MMIVFVYGKIQKNGRGEANITKSYRVLLVFVID